MTGIPQGEVEAGDVLVLVDDNGDEYALPMELIEQFKVPEDLRRFVDEAPENYEEPSQPQGQGDDEVAGHWWRSPSFSWGRPQPQIQVRQQPAIRFDYGSMFRGGNVISACGAAFAG